MATMTERDAAMVVCILLDPPGRLIDVERLQTACRKAEGRGIPFAVNPVTITREASGVVVRGQLQTVNAIQAAFLDPQSKMRQQFTNLTPEEEGEMNVRRAYAMMSTKRERIKKGTTKPVPLAPSPQRRKIRLED